MNRSRSSKACLFSMHFLKTVARRFMASACETFWREHPALGLIKLRPREEVQPRIVRNRARKAQRTLRAHKAADCSNRARLVTMSLVTHKSPRSACTPVERPRNAHDDDDDDAEKEEACPRIRLRIAVAAERREVSAVTFIGYKSSRYYAEPE